MKLAERKLITIYTDSRCSFATDHVHGAIYQQRGLLTSTGKDIKNKEEILSLLEAIHLPKKLAIIHCPGHQKGHDAVAKGNQMADSAAKQVAQGALILPVASKNKETIDYYDIRDTRFRYKPEDHKLMEKLKIVQGYFPYGVAEAEKGNPSCPKKRDNSTLLIYIS